MYRTTKKASYQAGFAFIEALLVLVVIGLLVGVGLYVAKQRQNVNSLSASTLGTSQDQKTKVTAKPGTAANVTELVEQSAQDEASISSQNDNAETQAALSANTAASNLGGAYDESTL
ncbi:MAG TPA: hypothetical protein VHD60_03385 [Candidatus Saccharimonadales bacterium]|nr:hypothetical protein [Candidatus Saccharimonadales bacterium]